MTENEFFQQALIHVGAALVKCYDEKADGIIDNGFAARNLSEDALDIASHLLDRAIDYDLFDEENEEPLQQRVSK